MTQHPQTEQNEINPALHEKVPSGAEVRIRRLETIVQQIGEAVLATTETIDRLAARIDALTVQVQHQGHQVQQQGYQVFALSDAVQTLAEAQNDSLEQIGQLAIALQHFVTAIEAPDNPNEP